MDTTIAQVELQEFHWKWQGDAGKVKDYERDNGLTNGWTPVEVSFFIEKKNTALVDSSRDI